MSCAGRCVSWWVPPCNNIEFFRFALVFQQGRQSAASFPGFVPLLWANVSVLQIGEILWVHTIILIGTVTSITLFLSSVNSFWLFLYIFIFSWFCFPIIFKIFIVIKLLQSGTPEGYPSYVANNCRVRFRHHRDGLGLYGFHSPARKRPAGAADLALPCQ